MSDTNNSLINIGNNKIVEKAYDDIISNPGKKIGEALGTIINVGNTLLWPIKWANERTRIYFENNLRKYEEKLAFVEQEKIIEVPTEISMPILERFTYVSNEEISNAFINLLVSASSVDTIQFAHPSFIQIIDRLSPDEAKIISYFNEKSSIGFISLSKYQLSPKKAEDLINPNYVPTLNTKQYTPLCLKNNNICKHIILNFPNNINIYIHNLISLGLLEEFTTKYYSSLDNELDAIENEIKIEFDEKFNDIPENLKQQSIKIDKGMIELTSFGELFVKSCIK